MMDRADAMYKELFADRRELIEEEPEYAYRAYIDYVTMYHRDLRDALQCYLDSKETFRDTDIEGFWELELMLYSNTFNEPERFETERQSFLERGLITEEQFHRTALIAYLTNLKTEKAMEHFRALKDQPHHILDGSDKTRQRAKQVIRGYSSESWHVEADGAMKKRFQIDKRIALDALIVLGDPKLAPQLVERYRHLILRVNELETLLGA